MGSDQSVIAHAISEVMRKSEIENNRRLDIGNSDETDLLEANQNNDSEITVALLRKKLISAVQDEDKVIVKSLLDEYFKTSDSFVKSWSSDSHPVKQERKIGMWRDAMYIAMEKDTKQSEEIMKLLLDCDIICCLDTKMNGLLLHRLIFYRKEDDDKRLRLIEMLLKSGTVNVNARDEYGRTALHLAKEEKLISLLIHYGVDVNDKNHKGKTPSMLMPGKNDRVSVLPTILKEARNFVDLDAVDYSGRTALMIAAIDNELNAVELLLNAGASVNLSDHHGFTALHHALSTRFDRYDDFPRNSEELKNRREMFTILFDAKDVEIDHSPWYWRNKEYSPEKMKIIEMLLQRPDVDVNALSLENCSPLDIAETVIPHFPSSTKEALIKKGAVLNVFRQTESQSTGEFHLDFRCRLTLERLLRITCVDYVKNLSQNFLEKRLLTLIETFKDQIVSGKDQKGRTALHLASIYFSTTWAVHWSLTMFNDDSKYPRDFVNTIVKELIAIGCSVNETDVFGRTPLHYADKILKELLIDYITDASIEDKDRNIVTYKALDQSSNKSSDVVKAVTDRNDETYFLRLMNNKQMEIKAQSVETKVRATDDREIWRQELDLKTVPRLLWEEGEYAVRHPLVEKITEEVTDLMSAIAKEIERLDPRYEIKPILVGSSNEGTKLDKPDEFDFCFVLTKISELCQVSLSPELPTGFVRLKRKPKNVNETSDFDSFFGKDGILNTEQLNWQFTTILSNAVVNIERQQSFEWILGSPIGDNLISESIKKVLNIKMINPLNFFTISIDIVPCIHVDGWWPDDAISNVSDEIKKFGCNLIFDRPHDLYPWVPYSESCARISFSKAESDMIKESCDNAREAYTIGKTMVKNSAADSHFTKYILKNCLLYCIEALTPTSEKASQLGLSLEELESKFHQMDRYLWLKCLLKCNLECVSQDFCPCYFLPGFSSPIQDTYLKRHSANWITGREVYFTNLCKDAYALYRCTLNDSSELCFQLPAPDPLWERFDRNQLISNLFKIAYK